MYIVMKIKLILLSELIRKSIKKYLNGLRQCKHTSAYMCTCILIQYTIYITGRPPYSSDM